MNRVLIIESAAAIAGMLENALKQEHYLVNVADNARSAWCSIARENYDAIVWNVLLSNLDPVRAIAKYRGKGGNAAIIALGEVHTIDFMERIFEAGADDFVETPFDSRKLVAAVKANVRRNPPAPKRDILRARDIEIDITSGTVRKHGEILHLFPKEYSLLCFLLAHPNQTFTSTALAERVWRDKALSSSDTIRTHIKTLRRKIDTPGVPSIIVNEARRGYKLVF